MDHAREDKRMVIHAIVRDLTDSGEGIAVLSCPEEKQLDGRVAFVPGALPGDALEILSLKSGGKPLRVSSYKIVEASAKRQVPPCPIFPECGGCTLQDMRYEETLLWKQKRVRDVLSRIAGLTDARELVRPCLGMETPRRFRGRVRLQHDFTDGVSALGFFGAGSNQVTETRDCLIQTESCNRVRKILKEMIQDLPAEQAAQLKEVTLRENRRGDSFLVLFHCGDHCDPSVWQEKVLGIQPDLPQHVSCWLQVGGDLRLIHLCGEDNFTEYYGRIRIDYSPLAFSQTNLTMDSVLFQTVVEILKNRIPAEKQVSILELYCGSGSLTLKLAEAFPQAHIRAVELFDAAIRDARRNAELNRGLLGDIPEFICADAADSLSGEDQADILVLDPPRQGLGKGVTAGILKLNPAFIVYISCDPATMARDIKDLKEHYQLWAVQPLDMFPWSTHVETGCLLSKLSEVKHHISVKADMEDVSVTATECKATYQEIQEWVQEKYGFHVTHLNIAQVKRKHDI